VIGLILTEQGLTGKHIRRNGVELLKYHLNRQVKKPLTKIRGNAYYAAKQHANNTNQWRPAIRRLRLIIRWRH